MRDVAFQIAKHLRQRGSVQFEHRRQPLELRGFEDDGRARAGAIRGGPEHRSAPSRSSPTRSTWLADRIVPAYPTASTGRCATTSGGMASSQRRSVGSRRSIRIAGISSSTRSAARSESPARKACSMASRRSPFCSNQSLARRWRGRPRPAVPPRGGPAARFRRGGGSGTSGAGCRARRPLRQGEPMNEAADLVAIGFRSYVVNVAGPVQRLHQAIGESGHVFAERRPNFVGICGYSFLAADQFIQADCDRLAQIHGLVFIARRDMHQPMAVRHVLVAQAELLRRSAAAATPSG